MYRFREPSQHSEDLQKIYNIHFVFPHSFTASRFHVATNKVMHLQIYLVS